MSNRLALAIFVVVAASATWWYAPAPSQTKETVLKLRHEHGPKHTAKLSGPVQVKVELEGEAPSQAGDVYKLVGVITSEQAIGNVTLKWKLGRHAELVSGSLEETVTLDQPFSEKRVSIQLRAKNAKAQRAHLRAFAQDGGQPFAVSGHYNSRPVPRDFTTKKDQLKETESSSEASDQKVFQ